MHIRILIIFFIVSISVNGQPKNYKIDPHAKLLADSAHQLLRAISGDTVNIKSAIDLLKQATAIDSNYIKGFREILMYQGFLRDYKGALATAKRICELRPQNPDFNSSLGIFYEINNDTASSKPYFKKALILYDKILDTLQDMRAIRQIKFSKAINLVFLNRNEEGQSLMVQLFQNSTEPMEKDELQKYLHKTKQEIITMVIRGEEEKISLPVQQKIRH